MSLETLINELVDKRLKELGVYATLGNSPASIRSKAGYINIDALATASGIPASTIRRYETGTSHHFTQASFKNFERIAELCGVTAREYALAVEAVRASA